MIWTPSVTWAPNWQRRWENSPATSDSALAPLWTKIYPRFPTRHRSTRRIHAKGEWLVYLSLQAQAWANYGPGAGYGPFGFLTRPASLVQIMLLVLSIVLISPIDGAEQARSIFYGFTMSTKCFQTKRLIFPKPSLTECLKPKSIFFYLTIQFSMQFRLSWLRCEAISKKPGMHIFDTAKKYRPLPVISGPDLTSLLIMQWKGAERSEAKKLWFTLCLP